MSATIRLPASITKIVTVYVYEKSVFFLIFSNFYFSFFALPLNRLRAWEDGKSNILVFMTILAYRL